MTVNTVRVDWMQDQTFLLRDRAGFPIVMAQPQGVNGADLLALGLIGCAAWDVVIILRKQRQKVTGLQVWAESEQEDEPPWRIRKIRIHYEITGCRLKTKAIQRAIELSETKYCSIYATLREAVELVTDYEVVEHDSF